MLARNTGKKLYGCTVKHVLQRQTCLTDLATCRTCLSNMFVKHVWQ